MMNRLLSFIIRGKINLCILFLIVCLVPGSGCISLSKNIPLSETLSDFACFNGLRIHYTSQGEGKQVIVFIHGWSCDTTFWRFQTPAFKKNWRVIVLDLPGHGRSSKPHISYTQGVFADAVAAVFKGADIESAILVGHSMGVSVVRQFIRKYPDKCKAFCIVDGVFFRVPKGPSEIEKWKLDKRAFSQNFKGAGHEKFIGQFVDSLFVAATPAELRKEIKSKMLNTPQYVANSAMESMFDPEIWEEQAVYIPTLAIYSKASVLSSPDNEQYLRKLFPNLEYHEWKDAGHFLMMEQPERFNRLLLNFLSKHAHNHH